MPVLQAMDGKFYDIPDDEAVQFEVPREKVKELLEKVGAPAPQGGPPGPQGGQPGPGQGSGPMQGPGGGMGAPPPSVLVQIYGTQPGNGPPQGQGQPSAQYAPPPGEPAQGGGEADGDVNPYWWWRNITFYRPWGNYWPNWGNW